MGRLRHESTDIQTEIRIGNKKYVRVKEGALIFSMGINTQGSFNGKLDLNNDRKVSFPDAKKKADDWGCEYIETSAQVSSSSFLSFLDQLQLQGSF